MKARIRTPWIRHQVGALSLVPATLLIVAGCSSSSGGSGGSDDGTGGQDGSTTRSGGAQDDGSTYGGSSGGGVSSSSGGTTTSSGSSSGAGSSGSSGGSSGTGGSSSGSGSSSSGSSGGKSSSGGSSSGGKDGGASGSSGGDATAEPACTTANAVCTGNDSGCNVGSYYLYDNQWNCGGSYTCGSESAYGCANPDGTVAFVVSSNQPAGNTAVLTYPAMQDNFDKNPTLGSFHTITATFSETSPHVGDYEVAWDCWFNDQANELMIWVDNYNQTPGGSKVGSNVALGGRTYDVFHSGTQSNGYIAFVATSNFTSGTVDLLEIFNYAATHGLMPAASTSTVGQLSFGIEVCSTNGQNATWSIDDYSITAN